MSGSFIVLAVLTAAVMLYAAWRRDGSFRQGLVKAGVLARPMAVNLPAALLAAAFIAALLPSNAVGGLIGAESGWRGVLLASLFGCMIPSGPMVSFPLAVSLIKAGAGLPQSVALLTAWSMIGLHRLVAWELPLMGWGFSWRRMAISICLAPLAGFFTELMIRLGW